MNRIVKKYENGNTQSVELYLNGRLHNEKGAAITHWSISGAVICSQYYVNGKRHREDGPAFIQYKRDETVEFYYLKGIRYNKKAWKMEVDRVRAVKELKNSKSIIGKITGLFK